MSGASGPALADPAARWADLRLRVISAAILAPIALFCVWAGGWLYGAMLVAGLIGVLWEWGSMCRWRPLPLTAGLVYAVASLLSLWFWRELGGALAIYFLLAVVWGSDIGAYAVGRIVGGPRLAPRVSPGKTWSGAAGGLVVAVIAGVLLLRTTSLWAVEFALVLGVASQLGDLGESALKRRYDVKDSGRMLPGHGGLLDRLDGLMAAALVAGAYLAVSPHGVAN